MKQTPVDFFVEEGKRFLGEGSLIQSLNTFEKGLETHQDNTRLLFWVGEVAFQMEDYERAKTAFKELLRYKPEHARALKMLCAIYERQEQWEDASQGYERLLILRPDEETWIKNRMAICKLGGAPDLSRERYKSFIFTHIQKTGGASLRTYIAKAAIQSGFAPKQLYIPGKHGIRAIDNLIMLYEHELEKVRERQPLILADHSHFNPVKVFKMPSLVDPFYYVMIREPIARVKSHYYFQYFKREDSGFYQTHLNDLNDEDLDEVLKLLSNYHIVYMTGYDFWNKGYEADETVLEKACENLSEKYDCFGVFEQMNTSIDILKEQAPKWLKLEGTLPQKNKSISAKDKAILSDRVLKRIKELNELDIKFYEFATQLFQSRYLDKNKQMGKKGFPEGTALPAGRFYFNPQYKTDKFESGLMHEYINVLQGLRYQPIKLLEIGVAEGGSVNYFSDYFQHPDAEIIGMDYQKPLHNPGFRENINFIVGDQNDPVRLNEIGTKHGPFDIIIDDGAHTLKETRHTYDCLFQYVKPGGYFIVEDWAAEFLDADKYGGMIDLMLELYRENVGIRSNEITLKLGHGFSYLLIRKK